MKEEVDYYAKNIDPLEAAQYPLPLLPDDIIIPLLP